MDEGFIMPIYVFLDTVTNEQFDMFMRISERDGYLNDNPHIQPVITAPMIVSGVSIGASNNKVPDGFKEVLSKVAEAHPNSVVGDRYGKKSVKQVRSDNVVKEHVKKITDKFGVK